MSYFQNKDNYPYVCANGTGNSIISVSDINTTGNFIFSNVIEDGLNNFNTLNGTFTASVKGLYRFDALLVCGNNGTERDDSVEWGFTITKNSVSSNRYTIDDPEYWSRSDVIEYNMRFSTIVMLNVGDSVKVTGSGANFGQVYYLNKCYFIGYLIAAFS